MKILTQTEAAARVKKFIGKQDYYHTATYDTAMFLSDDKDDDVFHYFELFGRKILWINAVELGLKGTNLDGDEINPRAVIPCNSPEDFDGVLIMNKLASLLCFVMSGMPISPINYSATGFPSATMVSDLQTRPYTVVRHDALDALIARAEPDNIPERKWIGMAHYRQGIIANSPYYTFLSFWKIVELYFDYKSSEISKYLDKVFKDPRLAGKLHEAMKTPTAKLYSTRNRCAHFALTQSGRNELQNPDDPDSYVIASMDARPLKEVVEELLLKGEWS